MPAALIPVILSFLKGRLSEPSTWAGFASYEAGSTLLNVMQTHSEVDFAGLTAALASTGHPALMALGVVMAMVLRERTKKDG